MGTPSTAHPAGAGAAFGTRLVRYFGVRGASVAVANLLSFSALIVAAQFLDPAELGRFAILIFLHALISVLFSLGVKQGSIMRTFGADDEDDDDSDGDGEGEGRFSSTPLRSLGTGVAMTTVLGVLGGALCVALRVPLAELLFGDAEAAPLVAWAGIAGGAGALFRLLSMVIWLERRPGPSVVVDVARPTVQLAVTIPLLASGVGLEGAVAGLAAGNVAGTLLAFWVLRRSLELNWDRSEARAILDAGKYRAPIIFSFWAVQQADVFVLSLVVSDADLGIYQIASRAGLLAAMVPQGLRTALRPLRKSAGFGALASAYGAAEARGQILFYFILVATSTLLFLVLANEAIVRLVPASYLDAAPLIPVAAAGMMMPTLLRTVNQQASWNNKRVRFIYVAVSSALGFSAITVLLSGRIGIYAAPVGMLAVFVAAGALIFVATQRGGTPMRFPYRPAIGALATAAVLAVGYELLSPASTLPRIGLAVAVALAYVVALFVLGIVPERHRRALAHIARSAIGRHERHFNPAAGLAALDRPERQALRRVVRNPPPPAELAPGGDGRSQGTPDVMSVLRHCGQAGGFPVPGPGPDDALLAQFLFADMPQAVRDAKMRRLLAAGVDSTELHALEELVAELRRALRP